MGKLARKVIVQFLPGRAFHEIGIEDFEQTKFGGSRATWNATEARGNAIASFPS